MQALVTVKSYAVGDVIFKENDRSQVLQLKPFLTFIFLVLNVTRQPGRIHFSRGQR